MRRHKPAKNQLSILYCVICGELMPHSNRHALYHSPACRQKAYRLRKAGHLPPSEPVIRWKAEKRKREILKNRNADGYSGIGKVPISK